MVGGLITAHLYAAGQTSQLDSLGRFCPGILQGDRSIKHKTAGPTVFVQSEIGQAFELVTQIRIGVNQAGFAFGCDDLKRMGI